MFRTRHRSRYALLTRSLWTLTRRGGEARWLSDLRAEGRDMVTRGYSYPSVLCGHRITFGSDD